MRKIHSYDIISLKGGVIMSYDSYNKFATAVKEEISQLDYEQKLEILTIVVSALHNENKSSPAEKFLKLSWEGDESAEYLLSEIEKNRMNSNRFEAQNALFD